MKAEVARLRKDLDEQSKRLNDVMKNAHEETDRLRQENLALQAKVYDGTRVVRMQERDEEIKAGEESLSK